MARVRRKRKSNTHFARPTGGGVTVGETKYRRFDDGSLRLTADAKAMKLAKKMKNSARRRYVVAGLVAAA